MEYKGYKYEIHGYEIEKRNNPELFYYDDDESEDKVLNNVDLFLEKIQDKEIGQEDYLDIQVNGSERWFPNNTLNKDLEELNGLTTHLIQLKMNSIKILRKMTTEML